MITILQGKFAQRSNLKKSILLSKPAELHKMITDDTISVEKVFPMTEDTLFVSFSAAEEPSEAESSFTNVVIAAFVTCQARLKLHEAMMRIGGERMLYCDTGNPTPKYNIHTSMSLQTRSSSTALATPASISRKPRTIWERSKMNLQRTVRGQESPSLPRSVPKPTHMKGLTTRATRSRP